MKAERFWCEGDWAYPNVNAAFRAAKRIARKKKEARFVIWDGSYHRVASEYDLDTFYLGTSDQNIRLGGRSMMAAREALSTWDRLDSISS